MSISCWNPFFTLFSAWHTIQYMNVGENFLEKNPIFVLFFGVAVSYFPIFLSVLLLDTLKSFSDLSFKCFSDLVFKWFSNLSFKGFSNFVVKCFSDLVFKCFSNLVFKCFSNLVFRFEFQMIFKFGFQIWVSNDFQIWFSIGFHIWVSNTLGCQLKPIKPFKLIFWPSNLLNLFNCQKTYLNFFLGSENLFFSSWENC